MPRGIIIFGPPGAGKTTLGRLTAKRLDFPYFDIDDYIWKKTAVPFTEMYSRAEKAGRLMAGISKHAHFVMAGSMDSFHADFDPLFDLAVYLTANPEIRMARIHQRELDNFGERILEGGDMYEEHRRFISDDYPNRQKHLEWLEELPCKVIRLDGETELSKNAEIIANEYLKITTYGENQCKATI